MSSDDIHVGSGNVFKDLDFKNPEERLAKSKLTRAINAIIKEERLTQAQAAEIVGLKQPKISLLSRGIVSGFSLEKLMKILNLLNQDIEIIVHKKPRMNIVESYMRGHIKVVCMAT